MQKPDESSINVTLLVAETVIAPSHPCYVMDAATDEKEVIIMMESTDIKVKLNSVDQVRQFVETMRKYEGDVDVYSTNQNYLVDGKSILGVFSLGLDQELTVKFYDGASESFISTLQPFMLVA